MHQISPDLPYHQFLIVRSYVLLFIIHRQFKFCSARITFILNINSSHVVSLVPSLLLPFPQLRLIRQIPHLSNVPDVVVRSSALKCIITMGSCPRIPLGRLYCGEDWELVLPIWRYETAFLCRGYIHPQEGADRLILTDEAYRWSLCCNAFRDLGNNVHGADSVYKPDEWCWRM